MSLIALFYYPLQMRVRRGEIAVVLNKSSPTGQIMRALEQEIAALKHHIVILNLALSDTLASLNVVQTARDDAVSRADHLQGMVALLTDNDE